MNPALMAALLSTLSTLNLPQAPAPTPAPAAAPTVVFGATLEGYWARNANHPDDGNNALRVYDVKTDSFAIQQAALVVEAPAAVDEGRRYGLRVDVQFGEAVAILQGSAVNEPRPDLYRNVWQAYGTYVFPVGRGLTVDFGKFASSLGLETNYAKDNDHFSRAFLFDFLPFYHMGARVSLPVTDRLTAYYMITNGAQQTEDFNGKRAQHGMVVAKLPADVQLTGSVFGSLEPAGDLRIVDAQAAWTPKHPITLGTDVSYTWSKPEQATSAGTLTGLGVYARTSHGSWAGAIRYERLDDSGGLFAGVAQLLQEVTATGEWRAAEGFLARLELRRDFSNHAVFPARDVTTSTSQTTLTVGVVFWIGTKKGTW
jgi:hypothetical protein